MSTYEFLDKLGISPNMPYRHARDSRRDSKHKVGFSYDAERDVYICPEGKILYRLSTVKSFLFCKNPSGDWYVTPI